MPESLIVIGNVDLISSEEFSIERVLKSIEQKNYVILIEGYGVLVMGKSAIQVGIAFNYIVRLTTGLRFLKQRANLCMVVLTYNRRSWNYRKRRLMKCTARLEDL